MAFVPSKSVHKHGEQYITSELMLFMSHHTLSRHDELHDFDVGNHIDVKRPPHLSGVLTAMKVAVQQETAA